MIRQKVLDTLGEYGPMTLPDLSHLLGIPQATIRAALTGEFYREVEFDHPKHGRVTAWALRPSALRVDAAGRYLVLMTEGK